jgi:hypothetical protein
MALIDVTWDVLLVLLIPGKTFTSHRVGARPGHPISRHPLSRSITARSRSELRSLRAHTARPFADIPQPDWTLSNPHETRRRAQALPPMLYGDQPARNA